jgi:hypothetical protein
VGRPACTLTEYLAEDGEGGIDWAGTTRQPKRSAWVPVRTRISASPNVWPMPGCERLVVDQVLDDPP